MDGSKSKNRVAVWGLVILIATVWVSQYLLLFIPSLMFNEVAGGALIMSIVGIVALVIGIMIGLKLPTPKDRLINAFGVGLFTLIFVHIAMVSFGLRSILVWGLILLLPTIVGALLGGLKKR